MKIEEPPSLSQVKLNGIKFLGVRIALEPEQVLKDYLINKLRHGQTVKITSITMGDLFKIFFPFFSFSLKKRHYKKMDWVYPDSFFACQTLFRYNKNFEGEKRVYSHRLLLNLIEETFRKKRSLSFIGIDENQKNNLNRRIRYLFPNFGDICYLNAEISKYQPRSVMTWLNRAHYGLVVVCPNRKLLEILLQELKQGLLFLNKKELDRYRKDWRKKPHWNSSRGMEIIYQKAWKIISLTFITVFKFFTLYYLLKFFFCLFFWIFSFIIIVSKIKKNTIVID